MCGVRTPPRGCTFVKRGVQDSCLANGASAAPVMTSAKLWRQLQHFQAEEWRNAVAAMYGEEDAELDE